MNKKVTEKAKEIKWMLSNYEKRSDLDEVLENIISSGIKMKYNHTLLISIFSILCFSGILFSVMFWDDHIHILGHYYDSGKTGIFITLISASVLLYPLLKNKKLNELSDIIYNLDLFDDNEFIFQVESEEYDRINNRFGCLKQGNHENIFTRSAIINGTPFRVHDYKFVEKSTTTSTDSKGNVTTRSTYSTYHRYMLEMSLDKKLDFISVLHDSSYDLEEFKPASIEFSDKYKCQGRDLHQVSMLVDPSFINMMDDINVNLGYINVRVSETILLIEWKDHPVFSKKRQFGIDNPVEFKEEINGHSSIYAVEHAIKFAELLSKHINLKFQ